MGVGITWEKHQAVTCMENTRLWTDLLPIKEKLFGGWSRKMWVCEPVLSTSFLIMLRLSC